MQKNKLILHISIITQKLNIAKAVFIANQVHSKSRREYYFHDIFWKCKNNKLVYGLCLELGIMSDGKSVEKTYEVYK